MSKAMAALLVLLPPAPVSPLLLVKPPPRNLLYPLLSISPVFLKESTKKDRYRCGFGGMQLKIEMNPKET